MFFSRLVFLIWLMTLAIPAELPEVPSTAPEYLRNMAGTWTVSSEWRDEPGGPLKTAEHTDVIKLWGGPWVMLETGGQHMQTTPYRGMLLLEEKSALWVDTLSNNVARYEASYKAPVLTLTTGEIQEIIDFKSPDEFVFTTKERGLTSIRSVFRRKK